MIAGAGVFALALIPAQLAGPVLVAAALLIALTTRLTRRSSTPPASRGLKRKRTIYVAGAGIVLIGVMVLAGTLARSGDLGWLAWVLAGIAFLVAAIGAWIDGA